MTARDAVQRAQDQFTADESARLVALREELHRHPELSWREEATATRLEKALRTIGAAEVRRVAGTGVVARIPGRAGDASPVALRGDIDALPITEETGLAWASTAPGVMHACGHDVHASWMVGAAMLLRRRPPRGDVVLVLQPAEEVGAGARAILAAGVLDGVTAIFGGHVDRRFAVGQVVAQPGPLAASADTFTITLTGRGAHGARPQEGSDPVVGASAVVMALQTVVARRIDPANPAVLTVGSIHGGTAPNVIPGSVTLTGTLRATRPEVRTQLQETLRELATGVAAGYGLAAELRLGEGTPPVVNSERESAWAREAATHVLGDGTVVPLGTTNMGGEDFACYLERVPGCFLRIGAREAGGAPVAAHSPTFVAAPESLFTGAAVLAECARTASGAG